MFTTIVLALFTMLGLVLVLKRRWTWTEGSREYSHPLWPYGTAVLALVAVWAAFAFTVQVPAKNVGVVTTFGKVADRNLGSGLHLIWPWQKVTTLDATIITDKFIGTQTATGECDSASDDSNSHASIKVRISDGTTACVSMVIRSQIDPTKANDLYANYRSDDVDANIFDSLIRTQLTSAAGSVFREFDPILANDNGQVAASSPNLQSLSQAVLAQMQNLLADASVDGEPEVNMEALTISYIDFSKTTEERINDLQAEVAKTRVAQQQEQTARAQAQANKELAGSVSHDPNVLVSKCLDTLNAMVQAGQPIPAGFTCWPAADNGTLVFGPGTSPGS